MMKTNNNMPAPCDSLKDFNLDMNATPFNDSISSIQWIPLSQNPNAPRSNLVAVTTWDGTLRVYDVTPNGLQQQFYIDKQSPITCCTWNADTNTSITFGCVDGSVNRVDLQTGGISKIGQCNETLRNVFYIPSSNTVLSVSYDKMINFWQQNNPSAAYSQASPAKIFCSDYVNGIFSAGTDNQKILIYDVTNMNNFTKPSVSDSYLQKKSQLSCMSLNHDGTQVAYGSIDGRGNISSIKKATSYIGNNTNSHVLSSDLIFKANKYEINGVNYVYPVNALGFNIKNPKWLFSAAADGVIQFWNWEGRNSVKTLNFNKTPVTAAKVSITGDLIIYALGDDWHQGPKGSGKWTTKLACHYIAENEVKFPPAKK